MKRIFFGFLLVFALSSVASAQSVSDAAETEILKREAAWRTALLKAGAGLEEIYSQHLSYHDWNGKTHERAVLIADVKSGQLKYQAVRLSKEKAQVFINTAIVTGEIELEGDYGATSISRKAKLMHVWVKEAGAWRLLVHQTGKAD